MHFGFLGCRGAAVTQPQGGEAYASEWCGVTDELCLARVVLWSSGAFWCPALQRCCCCATALGRGGGVVSQWRLVLPCLARVGLCFFGFSDGWCLVAAIAVYGGVSNSRRVGCHPYEYNIFIRCMPLALAWSSRIPRGLNACLPQTPGRQDRITSYPNGIRIVS